MLYDILPEEVMNHQPLYYPSCAGTAADVPEVIAAAAAVVGDSRVMVAVAAGWGSIGVGENVELNIVDMSFGSVRH
jgi:hypothetical protein